MLITRGCLIFGGMLIYCVYLKVPNFRMTIVL